MRAGRQAGIWEKKRVSENECTRDQDEFRLMGGLIIRRR